MDEEWCPKCGWEATATAPRAGTLHVDFDRTLEVTFASPPPLAQVAALRRVWPDAARTPVRQLLERLRAQPRIELSGMTYEQARGVRRELEDAGLRCTIVARDR